jgi:hypothetical protein
MNAIDLALFTIQQQDAILGHSQSWDGLFWFLKSPKTDAKLPILH